MSFGEHTAGRSGRSSGAGGGIADKLGNKYELAWAIHHALRCLQNERRSITFEDVDPDLSEGSEFTFVDEHGLVSVTQIKRQRGINDNWTIGALQANGVLVAAARHVEAGREFRFRSTTPCAALRSMSERARQSIDVENFLSRHITKELRPKFDQLTSPGLLGSAENAWRMLRGTWFEVGDEQELTKTNAMLASTMLTGAADSLLAVAVGSVLLENLRQRLTRTELLAGLRRHGISDVRVAVTDSVRDRLRAVTESWHSSVERELLMPRIRRAESDELIVLLEKTRLALVVGAGGGGKSAVLQQSARSLETQGAEVLSFRLDRCGSFSSTRELGEQLGLPASPVAALSMAASGRDAFLIVDQLDAVSLASGRLSQRYDVIADLIQEALSVPSVRVVLACRLFDVENDHRIRRLDAREDVQRLVVHPLPQTSVLEAVAEMGLDATLLTPTQLTLLSSPLNLVLLNTVAHQADALTFTSRGSLFEAFWQRKRQTIKATRREIRFNEVLTRVANAASDRQTLSVPVEILDDDDLVTDADVLASEQVLSITAGRVAFFHETFFDYTFARQWLTRDESLVTFLCRHEQELFRRAQVRQILELLRERDIARFRFEVKDSLADERVRSHLKETILAVLAGVADPTEDDLAIVHMVAEQNPRRGARAWKQIARPTWFEVLNSAGLIAQYLDSADENSRELGVLWLSYAGVQHGAAVVQLLLSRRSSPDYVVWLLQVAQRTDLYLNRSVLDLLLASLRSGEIGPAESAVWFATHELSSRQPGWALEMLIAYFIESPSSLALDAEGKVAILTSSEYSLLKLIDECSGADPRGFAEAFVPYLLAVMRATAWEANDYGPVSDRHYGYRFPDMHEPDEAEGALYNGVRAAVETLAKDSPQVVMPILRLLAKDPHSAAQDLLFHAVIANPSHFADWGAQLILQGARRLRSGYLSDGYAISREVVAAIASYLRDDDHARLEAAFLAYRNEHEGGASFGYTAFKFLSALDRERLSPLGARRLAEYQRKFEVAEPPPASGVISYTVSSPISAAAAARMSDDHWLRAMHKHDGGGRDLDRSVGGARELSQVLKQATSDDPRRFAGLAMRMSADLNHTYATAVLWGFGEASITADAMSSVFDAIRHIANLQLPECDRWLGWSVRRVLDETPLDVVQLLTERILHATDPESDHPAAASEDDHPGRDLLQHGINTARGALAEELGDLLVHDVDGSRTAVVAPHLVTLAGDSVLSVRACVAHTIAACLRHARPVAYAAFVRLVEADDVLLASPHVHRLMIYIGNADPELVLPVIDRMLVSGSKEVRHVGGRMAAFAALQWGHASFMARALAGDASTRAGVALVCGARIGDVADSRLLAESMRVLLHDKDDQVRKAAAKLVNHIEGSSLAPIRRVLVDLIESPSYAHASGQLLDRLQQSTDAIDELVDLAANRFLDLHNTHVADIRTGVAADAHHLSELIVRGLSQSRDRTRVAALLDILDRLVELDVYGVERALEQAERQ